MADNTYRFRSALGGYHKGDVIGFIEKAFSQHRTELLAREQTISALQEENRSLQQQLNLLMMATPVAAPAPEPAPEPEPAPAPAPEPVPAPAPVEQRDPAEWMQQELLAYRRAEAVERNANNRARKLYKQMEGLCADAMDEFQMTDNAVKQTLEVIQQQVSTLEQAYQTLSAALEASREKLDIMNEQLCDEE